MIRHGLQIFLGMLLLGAVPCFADVSRLPQHVYLEGRPFAPGTTDPNGWYVIVTTENSGAATYRRWTTDPATSFFVQLNLSAAENIWELRLYSSPSVVASYTSWSSVSYPSTVNITGGGVMKMNWTPDPYEEAFPDWDSAGAKIPLGFGFGLALWASALAFGIPMRWVRELTSAAS